MSKRSEYANALNALRFTPEQKAQLTENLISAAKDAPRKSRPIGKIAVIAACLAVLLAGTTLAAVGGPSTLKEWFSQQWQEVSGTAMMSETQAAAIETLTQPVGVSDTSGGVTVTLDSITVGDSCLWLLLKADGALSADRDPSLHHFGRMELDFAFDPDTNENAGGYGYDYGYVGAAADGRLTLLLRYTITLTQEDSLLTGYDAVLELTDLMYSDSIWLEGNWTLPFTIEPVEREVLTLESAVVPARDHENGGEAATVELTDIRVTATGIRFTQSAETQNLYPRLFGVLLKDGTEISGGAGGSRWLGETGTGLWVSDYCWQLPVDFSQITGLKFGDTVIPLN